MKQINLIYNQNVKKRLDEFLTSHEDIYSRSYSSKLIKRGYVTVNGEKIKKSSYKLSPHDNIKISLKNFDIEMNVQPEDVDFDIIFESENYLIINKPFGVVVHPGAGNQYGTLVAGIVKHLGNIPEGLDPVRPGIVHRLDKDTSGIMIVAKNSKSLAYYSDLFKNRNIKKTYLALVYGKVDPAVGIIRKNIVRHKFNRKKMTVSDNSGRYAETHYEVISYYKSPMNKNVDLTLLKVHLKTGRTHQIRVHFSDLGYPLVGDSVYGGKAFVRDCPKAERQLLHSYSLEFEDMEGKNQSFVCDLPKDFSTYLDNLENVDSK